MNFVPATTPAMEPPQPPPVRRLEWALLMFSLAVAATGLVWNSHEDLTVVACALTALDLGLVFVAALDCLRAGVLAKLLMSSAMLLYFWGEAVQTALQPVAFRIIGLAPRLPIRVWPPSLVAHSFIHLTLFALMLYAGYSFRPRLRRTLAWCRSWVDRRPIPYKRWALVLIPLCWIPQILLFGTNPESIWQGLLASRTARIGDPNVVGWFSQAAMLGLFGVALLIVDALVRERWFSPASLKRMALGLFGLVPFFFAGTRHFLLYPLIPPVVAILRCRRFQLTKKQILGAVAAGVVLLLFIQLQSAARDMGWKNLEAKRVQSTQFFGQYGALLYAEYLVPAHHDYFLEPVTPFFFTHLIPRKLWPGKPDMGSWTYYDYTLVGSLKGTSVTPSIVGQYHMNWGLAGVMWIGLWMGFLFSIADRAALQLDLERQRAFSVVVGMFYASLVAVFRFYAPYYFYFVVFAFLALLLTAHRQTPYRALLQVRPRFARAEDGTAAAGDGSVRPVQP